tara:strand:- start:3896 stop:4312 length:417 start_codon:yes stop_codon:yes gene_type:complete
MDREKVIRELTGIRKKVDFLLKELMTPNKVSGPPVSLTSTEYSESFLEFYRVYAVNKTKSQAYTKWRKLNQQQIDTIMSLIPLYHKAFEPKFRKYPNNFLSNNSWEDYIYLLEASKASENKATKVAEAQKNRFSSYDY